MTTQAANVPQGKSPAGPDGGSRAGEPDSRQEQAYRIVRSNVYWALGVGLVPIPIVDLVALTAVQVKMLKQLSDHYQVNFFEDKAKTIIGSLVTGVGSLSLTTAIAGSLFKVIPVIGQLVGFVGVPLLAGTLTMAIGRLFVIHYESGGTLLTFDASKLRDHFREELAQSRIAVKQMQTDPTEPIPP